MNLEGKLAIVKSGTRLMSYDKSKFDLHGRPGRFGSIIVALQDFMITIIEQTSDSYVKILSNNKFYILPWSTLEILDV
jgi:hypothetical protein